MLRGIYSSASGMLMEMDKVSMHAANIANAQSAGFRKHDMTSVPFRELVIDVMNDTTEKKIGHKTLTSVKVPVGTGSFGSYEIMDNSQGSLRPTGNTLDIAIQGNGWLTLQKAGTKGVNNQYTTRNGAFLLNDQGRIVNPEGDFLLDKKDNQITIQLPKSNVILDKKGKIIGKLPKSVLADNAALSKSLESRIVIKDNGDIMDNGKLLTTLKVQTDTNNIKYIRDLKLALPEQQVAQTDAKSKNLVTIDGKQISLKQGFIEESNVQIISEMVGLIHSSKNYESGHKLLMSEDKVLDKAINELGRTG